LLIDGTTADVRVAGLKYAEEVGLLDRAVYNSLVPKYRPEEAETIKEVGIEAAILLTFEMSEFTTSGRIKVAKSLLDLASKLGIKKPLVDTCVLDIPTLGMACRAIQGLKEELGIPVGCSPHNAVSTWKGLKSKMGNQAVRPALASASAMAAAVGGDFVLYGPIEAAPYVFPVVAMVDAAMGYYYVENKKMLDRSHPLFKIA
ncbi:MAG: tetrahydromethanopterin S-methyltransferase subunit H, partial [Thermoproteota archaeon]